MNRRWRFLVLWALFAGCAASGDAATRVKDIAYIQGARGIQLIGYGLVVGLNGSGDTQRSSFTMQSVSSMLKRFGITVPANEVRLRNAAAVMVTATVPAFSKTGGAVDVVVSSIGDANSLQGGTLLMTPLSGLDGAVYASAQGPLSVGGISVREGGSEMRRNHTAAGRIPGGALMERAVRADIIRDGKLYLVLLQADFTTALRIAAAVNAKMGSPIAAADDASMVAINIPDAYKGDGKLVEFVSMIEVLEVAPDVAAKVVINERTGTIVVGGNVGITSVAISHGGVNIEVQSTPVVSQPNSFSQGQTVLSQITSVSAKSDSSTVVPIEGAATVQEVARALNSLKVSPRDIIAIFQAMKEAGALKAELIII